MTAETYAEALYDVLTQTRPEDQDTVLDNFAKILVENGDTNLFPQIEELFHQKKLHASGIQQVHVSTAHDHPELLQMINDQIGKDVEVKHSIDQGLIGGVVIRIDDTLIDGSIKNSLEELKKTMKGYNHE